MAERPEISIIPDTGCFLGRIRHPDHGHPLVVTVRGGAVLDITSRQAPLVRDICEMDDPAGYVAAAQGRAVCRLDELAAGSRMQTTDRPVLLAPVDLQAIKASGVTFVVSLLERVIEEQARGDKAKAEALRGEITGLIGTDLSRLVPGSDEAMAVKTALVARGAWSQYLEVGIGPDAEIFTKCQPLSAVGYGATVGVHPISRWNNPEPEVAVAVASNGRMVGAMLGNDVNLRDVEGRSALLLGKAKDNNASASLGPFIRLFDKTFGVGDVETAEVGLVVEGKADGFTLEGHSSMRQISRSPASLVAAAMGRHHQYPDGMVLYLGTMFAPVEDRGGAGQGFTHKVGDVVTIHAAALGRLTNTVALSTDCPPWAFGASHLMRALSGAGLL